MDKKAFPKRMGYFHKGISIQHISKSRIVFVGLGNPTTATSSPLPCTPTTGVPVAYYWWLPQVVEALEAADKVIRREGVFGRGCGGDKERDRPWQGRP